MRRRLVDGSGYLEIDHTHSPGLSPSDVAGMPGSVAVPGGTKYEADVQQCRHCQRAVVLRPDRIRERGFCPKCDHYICDACEAIRAQTGACVPMAQRLDLALSLAERYRGREDDPSMPDPLSLEPVPIATVPNKV